MNCDHCQETLNAYVDDELPAEERGAVETHLANCVRCAGEHLSLAETRRLLHGELVRYRAPDVLKARIRAEVARDALGASVETSPSRAGHRRTPWWTLAAAAVVLAVASSTLTLAVVRQRDVTPRIGTELLASHVRSLMPGHLTDVVSTDQHNVKPWFNGRVDLSPSVPDLSANDFRLLGGRIDYVQNRATPVVVYARRQHIINVFSWPAASSRSGGSGGSGGSAPEASTLNGYHLIAWSRDGLDQWAVSDLNETELRDFVRLFSAAR
jgi:anti-sigma factor RsiW